SDLALCHWRTVWIDRHDPPGVITLFEPACRGWIAERRAGHQPFEPRRVLPDGREERLPRVLGRDQDSRHGRATLRPPSRRRRPYKRRIDVLDDFALDRADQDGRIDKADVVLDAILCKDLPRLGVYRAHANLIGA